MRKLALITLLALAFPALATINAPSSTQTVKPSSNGKRYGQYPLGNYTPTPPRVAYYIGSFETGALQAKASANDGFLLQTMSGASTVCLGTGGAGTGVGYDAHVFATGASIGADTVAPRAGSYLFAGSINVTTDYSVFCGTQTNKPRWNLNISDPVHRVDHDQEVWLGFSAYLPSDFEHENGVKDDRGSLQLLSIHSLPNGSIKEQMQISAWVPSGASTAHWFLTLYTDATSITGSSGKREHIDLGEVVSDADLGRWTDYVVRFRLNPFTTTTNASTISGGKNQSYAGNKGILQVWKAKGTASPNRVMTRVINRVDVPIGLVPAAADSLQISFREYKYGWHNNPTTVSGPIDIGLDEIRFGCVDNAVSSNACDAWANTIGVDTGYADVHPTQQAQP